MTRYSIGGIIYASSDLNFQAVLEAAYQRRIRPLCLCCDPGLPMYIAHLERAYVVKRMPDSGAKHGPACESYEAPPGLSGRGEVDGQAIEHADEGTVNLKLAFSLRHNKPAETENESVGKTTAKTSGTRLTLRGLLHYLWDESKLSHWSPEVQGKRSWFSVRNALVDAAESKETKSAALKDILYIPEVYDAAKRNDIYSRRIRLLSSIMGPGKSGKKLMMLVGELDTIDEATFGFLLRIKDLPDFPLVMGAELHKSFEKVFKGTMNLRAYTPKAHAIVIATFSVDDKGIPAVDELCVMLTGSEWIPFDNQMEYQLVEQLVAEERCFQKQLRYNLPPDKPIATAVLTDCDNAPLAMYIDINDLVGRWASTVAMNDAIKSNSVQWWMWVPIRGVAPDLPPKKGMAPKPVEQSEERPARTLEAAAAPPSDWGAVAEPATVDVADLPPETDERPDNVTSIKQRPVLVQVPPSVAAATTPEFSVPANVTSIDDARLR